ncbi:hypothetical protein WJX81_002494 [Elliptochloris bilobata]|uniref:PKD/REJ-like domain-containing protein n=1 Tax=Elliptochloris bilobata TaxID=381761 RepID=A0AAW1RJ41_9CHLO
MAGLAGGTYTVTLTVTDWLAQTANATWTFTKAAAALPLVQLVGGAQQSFTISQGIKVPVQIFLQSVCPGSTVVYNWTFASGSPQFVAPFAATRKDLVVSGASGVVGATAGTTYDLQLTTNLLGTASYATSTVQLTAVATPVIAAIRGPQGDVLSSNPIALASACVDPDAAATPSASLQAFQYAWSCYKTDAAQSYSQPCFNGQAGWTTDLLGNLLIPANTLPGDDNTYYYITLVASKPDGRSDTATAVLRVRSGVIPTGTVQRSCLPAPSCPKKHSPTNTLRLAFSPSAATADLPGLSYAWACRSPATGCPILAAPGVTSGGTAGSNLVINALDAMGNSVFSDGVSLVFALTITNPANGKVGLATVLVPMIRRPVCTGVDQTQCVASSPATGTALTTPYTLSANSWASDNALAYEFGVQHPDGTQDSYVTNSGSAAYTFASLPTGSPASSYATTLYACVRDAYGASNCTTTMVTVNPPAANFAVNASALTDSLTTATSSGDPTAVMSAVRSLAASTAAAAPPPSVAAGVTTIATVDPALVAASTTAIDALTALVTTNGSSSATLSGSAALSVVTTLLSLTANPAAVSPAAAPAALAGAAAVVASTTGAGATTTLRLADMKAIFGLVANALAITTSSSGAPGGRRRLQQTSAALSPTAALTQLAAVQGPIFGVLSAASASMVVGETPKVISGGTVTGMVSNALTASLAGVPMSLVTSSSSSRRRRQLLALTLSPQQASPMAMPSLTLPSNFATACAAAASGICPPNGDGVQATIAYFADPSLLVQGHPSLVVTVAGTPVTAAPITGYLTLMLTDVTDSTFVMDTIPGSLTTMQLPLLTTYQPGNAYACLRLDATQSNGWSAYAPAISGVTIASVSSTMATCTTSRTGTYLAVQFVYLPGATLFNASSPPPPPAAPPPPPGAPAASTPAPTTAPGLTTSTAANVPQVSFSARLTTYTVATFNHDLQTSYMAHMKSVLASGGANCQVVISDLRPGSVIVDTKVAFIDGNRADANIFASMLQGPQATVFFPASAGFDTTYNMGVAVATVSNPTLAPPSGSGGGDVARRIGLGVGLGLGLPFLLAAAFAAWWVKFRQAAAGGATAPPVEEGGPDAAPLAPQEQQAMQTQT